MQRWMIWLAIGVILDVAGVVTLVTHLGKTLGVVAMIAIMIGVIFTRSGVLGRRAAAQGAARG